MLGAALALLALAAPPDSLPAPERAIVRAVDARVPAAEALLERLVNVNSGTMNAAGVREVGAMLRPGFDALGFTTRWEDGTAVGRAGHLIAERTGRGPRILLIGHLDTVFEPGSPLKRWERLGDSARGPGVTDMKGGDVIILTALQALADAGVLDEMSVTVVLHGDEEDPGEPLAATRRTLVEAARRSRAALGFEDGDGDPRTAVAARRGAVSWTLRVRGTPAHSSQVFRPDIGFGAVYEAARILDGFRLRLSGEALLTVNPGLALGGTRVTLDSTGTVGEAGGKTNVVAETMVVSGDVRTISPEQLERTIATMRELVSASLPGTSATLDFADGYPPMAPTEGNRQLLAMYDAVSRDLGFGPVGMDNPARAGAADVSFAAGIVPMAIDGLGLGGRDGHTVHETGDLRSLPMQAKRAAVLMHRLSRAGGR